MLLPGQRQSATARYLGIELDPRKNQIDKDKLTECQGEQHFYPAAMAAYLEQMAQDLDDNLLMIRDLWEGYRITFQENSQHLRIPEILAWLTVGFEIGLQFQTSMGAITPEQSYEMLNRAWKTFKVLGDKHSQILLGDRPTVKFMAVLRELFIQGRIYVESSSHPGVPPTQNQRSMGWHGSEPEHSAEMVGWANDDTLYLLPETTVRVVKETIRRQGDFLSLGRNELLAALSREELISPGKDGKNTQVRWIQGGSKRVICLPLEKLAHDEVIENASC